MGENVIVSSCLCRQDKHEVLCSHHSNIPSFLASLALGSSRPRFSRRRQPRPQRFIMSARLSAAALHMGIRPHHAHPVTSSQLRTMGRRWDTSGASNSTRRSLLHNHTADPSSNGHRLRAAWLLSADVWRDSRFCTLRACRSTALYQA